MASHPGFSAQTLSVLAALCDEPSQWQHGYALAKQTGLKSGTLYPILIRLADRGLVEACWQHEPAARPAAAAPVPADGRRAGQRRRGDSQHGRAGAELAAARAGIRRTQAGTRTAPAGRGAVAGVIP